MSKSKPKSKSNRLVHIPVTAGLLNQNIIHFTPDDMPFELEEDITIHCRGRVIPTGFRIAHMYMVNRAGVGGLVRDLNLKLGDVILLYGTGGQFKVRVQRAKQALTETRISKHTRYAPSAGRSLPLTTSAA
jgi:hypothetical protein